MTALEWLWIGVLWVIGIGFFVMMYYLAKDILGSEIPGGGGTDLGPHGRPKDWKQD